MDSPFASPPRVGRRSIVTTIASPPNRVQQFQSSPSTNVTPVRKPDSSALHHSYNKRLFSPSRSRPSPIVSTRGLTSPLRSPSRVVQTSNGPMREFFSMESPSHSAAITGGGIIPVHDRSIPNRYSSNLAHGFALSSPSSARNTETNRSDRTVRHSANTSSGGDSESSSAVVNRDALERYDTLLQNELLGACDEALADPDRVDVMFHPNAENCVPSAFLDGVALSPRGNVEDETLAMSSRNRVTGNANGNENQDEKMDAFISPRRVFRFESSSHEDVHGQNRPYSLTPIKKSSQAVLCAAQRMVRKIPKSPFKVLDAPRLTDDFYLNLVDWSSQNTLCVGLAECVYLWSASTCQVNKLVDLSARPSAASRRRSGSSNSRDEMVCALAWSRKGNHISVGTRRGEVLIYDVIKGEVVYEMNGHNHRVGVMAWNGNIIASGSRDRSIHVSDLRAANHNENVMKLSHHKQEVCGLKWSFHSHHLASGGNDNKLLIWDVRKSSVPICVGKHRAAIKAITWSPHQHGLIASGGGTADRTIRFWNTLESNTATDTGFGLGGDGSVHEMRAIEKLDTGSQVCNLLWSKNVNEIVSTHGYSLNQIVVWKYPTMEKLATLTGHTYRVLYLAGSPDGQTIVTGAGDETLRFWNVFPAAQSTARAGIGELSVSALASATKIR